MILKYWEWRQYDPSKRREPHWPNNAASRQNWKSTIVKIFRSSPPCRTHGVRGRLPTIRDFDYALTVRNVEIYNYQFVCEDCGCSTVLPCLRSAGLLHSATVQVYPPREIHLTRENVIWPFPWRSKYRTPKQFWKLQICLFMKTYIAILINLWEYTKTATPCVLNWFSY